MNGIPKVLYRKPNVTRHVFFHEYLWLERYTFDDYGTNTHPPKPKAEEMAEK